MTKSVCSWMVGGALLALALVALTAGSSLAGLDEDAQKAAVRKIAAQFEAGDAEGATKAAADVAKKVEGLDEIMYMFKPRSKGGEGVGEKKGQIVPDGIELKLIGLGRDGLSDTAAKKEGAAIAKMAHIMAAIGEVTKHYDDGEFNAKKTKKDWQMWSDKMREGSLKLAEAAKAGGGGGIQTAAKNVGDSCNGCHSLYRE